MTGPSGFILNCYRNRATPALMLSLLCLTACSPELELVARPETPLARTIEASEPAFVKFRVDGGAWRASFGRTVDVGCLLPGEHQIEAKAGRTAASWTVEVPPLPRPFPTLEAIGETDGSLLLPLQSFTTREGYFAIVSPTGAVEWLYLLTEDVGFLGEVRRLANGHVWLQTGAWVREVTLGGEIVREWRPEPGEEPFHHDATLLPGGGLLTLGAEFVDVADFPLSDMDPSLRGPATLRDSTVIFLEPDGSEWMRWGLADILPTTRIGYSGAPNAAGVANWVHANAAEFTHTGRVLLSLRHQDAVLQTSLDGAEIDWILAPDDNWEPGLPVLQTDAPPWHPHAPEWTSEGTLLLFDNNVPGASPWTGGVPDFGRAAVVAEFEINAEAGTAERVWEWGPGLVSTFLGDADELPGGRVLGHFGGITQFTPEQGGSVQSRTYEVDRDGVVHWELRVYDTPGEPTNWMSYRSERVAGVCL